jgi:drug/metabolite transporter (DMT)-like permease
MRLRGVGYALTSSCMFGLGAVLAKMASEEVAATLIACVALLGGGLLLTGLLALLGRPAFQGLARLRRGEWLDLLLLALLGTALPLWLMVAGLAQTSALVGGFLLQFVGVAALLFGVLLLGERLRPLQGLGMLLLLAGGVLVVLRSAQSLSWGGTLLGDLLVLAGATGLGFGFIPARRLGQRCAVLPLTTWRLLIGGLALLLLACIQMLAAGTALLWRPSPALLWVVPLYIVTNFCLAYVAQQEGLRLLKAWEVGALAQSVPLFSTCFSLLLLHESLTPLQTLGALLTVLGGLIIALSERLDPSFAAPVAAAPTPASGGTIQPEHRPD